MRDRQEPSTDPSLWYPSTAQQPSQPARILSVHTQCVQVDPRTFSSHVTSSNIALHCCCTTAAGSSINFYTIPATCNKNTFSCLFVFKSSVGICTNQRDTETEREKGINKALHKVCSLFIPQTLLHFFILEFWAHTPSVFSKPTWQEFKCGWPCGIWLP